MLTRARLKVYDVSGPVSCHIARRHAAGGTRELVWNARDQAQREVANGVYLLKFESSTTRRLRS